jgi:hypothetical protein
MGSVRHFVLATLLAAASSALAQSTNPAPEGAGNE